MKLRSFVLINCIILFLTLVINGIWLIRIEGKAPVPKSSYNKEPDRVTKLDYNKPENNEKAINIIIMGLDDEEVRSDVILLLNIDAKFSKLNILSIARDTKVKVNNRNIKINALIGAKGEKQVIEKVEELVGLPVHYYVTMNFEGFRNIIDTLGGVEIDVPFNMNYDDPEQNLHIHLRKGKQLLNGKKAEQFVRYRKGNRPGTGYTFGDLGRIKAQQQFIKALIDQKMKIKYLSKADEIFLILKRYLNTNIEIGDINYYLDELMEMKLNQVDAYTLPGDSAYVKGIWYFMPDEKKIKELVDNHFFKW